MSRDIKVWWNSGRKSVWDVTLTLTYISIMVYESDISTVFKFYMSMVFGDFIYWQNYDYILDSKPNWPVGLTNLIVCIHTGRSTIPGDLLQGGEGHSQTLEHRLSFYTSFCCTHIGNWLYNNCLCFQSEQGLSPLDMFL